MIWYLAGTFATATLLGGLYICRKWWLWKPVLGMGTIVCLLNWQHHELVTVLLIYALFLAVVTFIHAREFAHEMNLRLNLPHPEDCACGGRIELP